MEYKSVSCSLRGWGKIHENKHARLTIPNETSCSNTSQIFALRTTKPKKHFVCSCVNYW